MVESQSVVMDTTAAFGLQGITSARDTSRAPPSPLSGGYLLIVISEPRIESHKAAILQKISKAFLSWDVDESGIDIERELAIVTALATEGDVSKNGERLIQNASEHLVTEILIQPQINTLRQCVRNLLSSFTKYRFVIHAGYTFSGNGSWILQDGTFSMADFIDAFQEIEVQRVIKAYDKSVKVDVCCIAEGSWNQTRINQESFSKICRIEMNPRDKLSSGSVAINEFAQYLDSFIIAQDICDVLEPSKVVGNIRFSRPTLYVFPGGDGDAALFGINGFNMLVDGGFNRRACFWNFVRHLDRLDAVLQTRINNTNIGGMAGILQRKVLSPVYPQIGHFFGNLQMRKRLQSLDGNKDREPLLVNLIEEGGQMVLNLKHLQLKPHPCYREPNNEPINLYHKVGHGKLDMYVVSPAKDSREVKEFLSQWHNHDKKLFSTGLVSSKNDERELHIPAQNLVSICALLVWQPANTEDNITRILFPGSAPQHKIFEGMDCIKQLEFLKSPVCLMKKILPATSTISKMKLKKSGDIRISHNQIATEKIICEDKPSIIKSVLAENEVTNDLTNEKMKKAQVKQKQIEKSQGTISNRRKAIEKNKEPQIGYSIEKSAALKGENEFFEKKETKAIKADIRKSEKKVMKIEKKGRSSTAGKKIDLDKSSPTTPKKLGTNIKDSTSASLNATEKDSSIRSAHVSTQSSSFNQCKTSPKILPAKRLKEENNRRMVAAKQDTGIAPLKTITKTQPVVALAAATDASKMVKKEHINAKVTKAKTTKQASTTATTSATVVANIPLMKAVKRTTGTTAVNTTNGIEEQEKGVEIDRKSVSSNISVIDTNKESTKLTTTGKDIIKKAKETSKLDIPSKVLDSISSNTPISSRESTKADTNSNTSVYISNIIRKEAEDDDDDDEILIIETTEIESTIDFNERKYLLDEKESEKGKAKSQVTPEELHDIKLMFIKNNENLTQSEDDFKEIEKQKVNSLLTPEEKEDLSNQLNDITITATQIVINEKSIPNKEKIQLQKKGINMNKVTNSIPVHTGVEEDVMAINNNEKSSIIASTMPEDERIDEIKHKIEKKYDKEVTQENGTEKPIVLKTTHQGDDNVISHITNKSSTEIVPGEILPSSLPSQKKYITNTNTNILKTPDEVADLPVHEEVDLQQIYNKNSTISDIQPTYEPIISEVIKVQLPEVVNITPISSPDEKITSEISHKKLECMSSPPKTIKDESKSLIQKVNQELLRKESKPNPPILIEVTNSKQNSFQQQGNEILDNIAARLPNTPEELLEAKYSTELDSRRLLESSGQLSSFKKNEINDKIKSCQELSEFTNVSTLDKELLPNVRSLIKLEQQQSIEIPSQISTTSKDEIFSLFGDQATKDKRSNSLELDSRKLVETKSEIQSSSNDLELKKDKKLSEPEDKLQSSLDELKIDCKKKSLIQLEQRSSSKEEISSLIETKISDSRKNSALLEEQPTFKIKSSLSGPSESINTEKRSSIQLEQTKLSEVYVEPSLHMESKTADSKKNTTQSKCQDSSKTSPSPNESSLKEQPNFKIISTLSESQLPNETNSSIQVEQRRLPEIELKLSSHVDSKLIDNSKNSTQSKEQQSTTITNSPNELELDKEWKSLNQLQQRRLSEIKPSSLIESKIMDSIENLTQLEEQNAFKIISSSSELELDSERKSLIQLEQRRLSNSHLEQSSPIELKTIRSKNNSTQLEDQSASYIVSKMSELPEELDQNKIESFISQDTGNKCESYPHKSRVESEISVSQSMEPLLRMKSQKLSSFEEEEKYLSDLNIEIFNSLKEYEKDNKNKSSIQLEYNISNKPVVTDIRNDSTQLEDQQHIKILKVEEPLSTKKLEEKLERKSLVQLEDLQITSPKEIIGKVANKNKIIKSDEEIETIPVTNLSLITQSPTFNIIKDDGILIEKRIIESQINMTDQKQKQSNNIIIEGQSQTTTEISKIDEMVRKRSTSKELETQLSEDGGSCTSEIKSRKQSSTHTEIPPIPIIDFENKKSDLSTTKSDTTVEKCKFIEKVSDGTSRIVKDIQEPIKKEGNMRLSETITSPTIDNIQEKDSISTKIETNNSILNTDNSITSKLELPPNDNIHISKETSTNQGKIIVAIPEEDPKSNAYRSKENENNPEKNYDEKAAKLFQEISYKSNYDSTLIETQHNLLKETISLIEPQKGINPQTPDTLKFANKLENVSKTEEIHYEERKDNNGKEAIKKSDSQYKILFLEESQSNEEQLQQNTTNDIKNIINKEILLTEKNEKNKDDLNKEAAPTTVTSFTVTEDKEVIDETSTIEAISIGRNNSTITEKNGKTIQEKNKSYQKLSKLHDVPSMKQKEREKEEIDLSSLRMRICSDNIDDQPITHCIIQRTNVETLPPPPIMEEEKESNKCTVTINGSKINSSIIEVDQQTNIACIKEKDLDIADKSQIFVKEKTAETSIAGTSNLKNELTNTSSSILSNAKINKEESKLLDSTIKAQLSILEPSSSKTIIDNKIEVYQEITSQEPPALSTYSIIEIKPEIKTFEHETNRLDTHEPIHSTSINKPIVVNNSLEEETGVRSILIELSDSSGTLELKGSSNLKTTDLCEESIKVTTTIEEAKLSIDSTPLEPSKDYKLVDNKSISTFKASIDEEDYNLVKDNTDIKTQQFKIEENNSSKIKTVKSKEMSAISNISTEANIISGQLGSHFSTSPYSIYDCKKSKKSDNEIIPNPESNTLSRNSLSTLPLTSFCTTMSFEQTSSIPKNKTSYSENLISEDEIKRENITFTNQEGILSTSTSSEDGIQIGIYKYDSNIEHKNNIVSSTVPLSSATSLEKISYNTEETINIANKESTGTKTNNKALNICHGLSTTIPIVSERVIKYIPIDNIDEETLLTTKKEITEQLSNNNQISSEEFLSISTIPSPALQLDETQIQAKFTSSSINGNIQSDCKSNVPSTTESKNQLKGQKKISPTVSRVNSEDIKASLDISHESDLKFEVKEKIGKTTSLPILDNTRLDYAKEANTIEVLTQLKNPEPDFLKSYPCLENIKHEDCSRSNVNLSDPVLNEQLPDNKLKSKSLSLPAIKRLDDSDSLMKLPHLYKTYNLEDLTDQEVTSTNIEQDASIPKDHSIETKITHESGNGFTVIDPIKEAEEPLSDDEQRHIKMYSSLYQKIDKDYESESETSDEQTAVDNQKVNLNYHSTSGIECKTEMFSNVPASMTQSFYGSLPSDDKKYEETHSVLTLETAAITTSSINTTNTSIYTLSSTLPTTSNNPEKKDDSKEDPISDWGKPLGLPLNKNANSLNDTLLTWNPLENWGKPFGLPSPGPPPSQIPPYSQHQNSDSDIELNSTTTNTKVTPKKVILRRITNEKSNTGRESSRLRDVPTTKKTTKSDKSLIPIYVDLAYIPHHGNPYYTNVEFFKRIRARYYVFSGTDASKDVFNALLEAKKSWENHNLEVTIIPTYDTDALGYWITENEEAMSNLRIDLAPSASRCTINLQDHDTSCSAYRLEF